MAVRSFTHDSYVARLRSGRSVGLITSRPPQVSRTRSRWESRRHFPAFNLPVCAIINFDMRIASWEYIISRTQGAVIVASTQAAKFSALAIIIQAEIIPRREIPPVSQTRSCHIILMATLLTLTHFASCFPRERAMSESCARAPVRVNYRPGTHLGIFLAPRRGSSVHRKEST